MTIARVLVVDDDAAVRRMLVDYLGAHDYAVDVAADGTELRQYFERQTPDVVLLDVGLPGEDGLSLARYLRERYAVGIIMVTGADGVVDRVVGLEMGADDYIAKPFDPRELRARLKSVLRRLRTDGGVSARTGGTDAAANGPLLARCRRASIIRTRWPGGADHGDGIRTAEDLSRTSEQGADA